MGLAKMKDGHFLFYLILHFPHTAFSQDMIDKVETLPANQLNRPSPTVLRQLDLSSYFGLTLI